MNQYIACMKKGITQEIKERVERIEGMDIFEASKLRYISEKRSTRWLSSHWNVNNRTVLRILAFCGIATRKGGEAVACQWLNNPERREKAGKRLAQINHELALKGLHVRQGVNKFNSLLMKHISEKLKHSSSFLRPEIREKAHAKSMASRAEHPERMSALRFPLSKAEILLAEHLTELGLQFEIRHLMKTYVVDFYIPQLSLVIDCQGRNRFPLSYKRHQEIASQCASIIYCVNNFVERGIFGNLDEYIATLQSLGSAPTIGCKKTMIFGACGNSPFGVDTNKFIVHKFGVYANNYTSLTTASDD